MRVEILSSSFLLLFLANFVNGMSSRIQVRADDAGCQGRLDLAKFEKVNRICDECYSLYKEIDVYRLCRADCFGTKIFYGCMEALLVKDELKKEVSSYLEDAHTGYYDHLSKKK